jgi:DNA-binding transcriptional ArsR family regulator
MSKERAAGREKANRALVKALIHPLSFEILGVLAERNMASGKEIARLLSKPRSTVGDQLRRLEAHGLIETAAEDSTRGTVERFYRGAPAATWVSDEDVALLGAEEKRQMGLRVVRSAVVDASAALSGNTLDQRNDWCLSSTRLSVDEEGWRELAELHKRTMEEVERVRRQSRERMASQRATKAVRALSSIMLVELPQAPDS